ncbi:unnamed protein product, partial [Polarella glacialis]
GLCVAWGPGVEQMTAMLRTVGGWRCYGVHALKEECHNLRIPTDGLHERADVLVRLFNVLAWQHMSVLQLQSECWRRRVPYVAQTRVSNVVLLET